MASSTGAYLYFFLVVFTYMRGIIYKERNGNIGKDLKMEREVEVKELHVDNHGECIYGIAHIPADRKGPVPMVFCVMVLGLLQII